MTGQDRITIRVHDVPTGSGNISMQQVQLDGAFENGVMTLISERTKHYAITELVRLGLEKVKASDGGQKSFSFSKNNAGAQDEISCSHRERWGILKCKTVISRVEKSVELQCSRVTSVFWTY